MDCSDLQALLTGAPWAEPGTPWAEPGEDPLPAAAQEHLRNCLECQALQAELARLDQLLLTEPVLPAPPGLAAEAVARVAARRTQDQVCASVWARRRARATLAAACALVLIAGLLGLSGDEGGLLGWALGWEPASEWELSLGLLQQAQGLAAAAWAQVDPLLQVPEVSFLEVLGASALAWLAPLVLLPVLALNLSLCRWPAGRQEVAA